MSFDFAKNAWFLTGPTASGKSDVGVELAARLDAEIISMDSMALYRGMDIGTAKPTMGQRRRAPHHLVDVLEPHEEYSLAQYVEAAGRKAAEISGRGREVLFVGGTPLYLKGLLRGIFEGPPADWPLRRRLAEQARQRGDRWLHDQVVAIDPDSAARLHPNDARRLIRALEVFEKTGRPISALQRQFDVGRPAEACRVFVLDWPKEELLSRIDRRVEAMFAAGLVDEVRSLLAGSQPFAAHAGVLPSPFGRGAGGEGRGVKSVENTRALDDNGPHPNPLPKGEGTILDPLSKGEGTILNALQKGEGTIAARPMSRTARQAVGYREVLEYIEGRSSLSETVELVRRHTRQLAKRQGTWFRSLVECRFIPVAEPFDAYKLAGSIMGMQ